VDTDSDTWYAGCDRYSTINGPDCSDTNTNAWTNCATCVDTDVDTWYAGCDRYQTIGGPDCNNGNTTVHPGAPSPESPDYCDGVDNQCPGDVGYGDIDEGCTPAWDTDYDGIPDDYEIAHAGDPLPLDYLNAADGALDSDGDLNPNAHEYWNGTDYRVLDPVGAAGCFFWGDANGDGYIGTTDLTVLQQLIKSLPTDYSDVIPNTGETQDLNADGYYGTTDMTILTAFSKTGFLLSIPSRPVSIAKLSPATVSVAVGDTTHVTVGLPNEGGAGNSPGFGVVFSIDPTSPGHATIFGGEGADGDGHRYDVTETVSLSAPANVVIRVDQAGEIRVNVSVPKCGEDENMGRYCAALEMAEPFVITGY